MSISLGKPGLDPVGLHGLFSKECFKLAKLLVCKQSIALTTSFDITNGKAPAAKEKQPPVIEAEGVLKVGSNIKAPGNFKRTRLFDFFLHFSHDQNTTTGVRERCFDTSSL